jgi:hypothetical protein
VALKAENESANEKLISAAYENINGINGEISA